MSTPISQQELKETLDYTPLTGVFTWRKKTCRKVVAGTIAGSNQTNGYACIRINKRLYLTHRLVFLYMQGYLPTLDVDHINGIRTDNRWDNLREVTRQDNLRNSAKPSTNTSGVIGVSWSNQRQKWFARISVNNKTKYLGVFENFDEAVLARTTASNHYNFHPNHGRAQTWVQNT